MSQVETVVAPPAGTIAQIERLEEACAEAYQVVADLAERLGCVDHPAVVKVLDNLHAAMLPQDPRPHGDAAHLLLLPDTYRSSVESQQLARTVEVLRSEISRLRRGMQDATKTMADHLNQPTEDALVRAGL